LLNPNIESIDYWLWLKWRFNTIPVEAVVSLKTLHIEEIFT